MSQIILDSANDLIQGDFDNATLTQRTRLQTSTVNATTGVYIIPNGTANAASVQISNNSNVTNASKVVLATNGSTDTQIISGANGSGTYLPLSFYTNNDIRLQVNNSGALGVRTGPGTVGFGTSGQVLTSNGSGTGVSWTTIASGSPGIQAATFSSPGTFTVPSSTTAVKVTVIGGGGGGGNATQGNVGGGGGGSSGVNIQYITGITPGASIPVTVGSGGGGSTPGGTSSIGPFGPGGTVSQTGGTGGSSPGGAGSGSAGGGFGYNGSSGSSNTSANGGNGAASGMLSSVISNGLFLSTGGSGSPGPSSSPGSPGTRGGGGGGGSGGFLSGGGSGGAGLVIVEF